MTNLIEQPLFFGLWNPSSDVRRVAHKPFRTLEPQFSDVSTPNTGYPPDFGTPY